MVVTTGFFDGLHLGHRKVIETLVRQARLSGQESRVVTFWPHPRNVLQNDARNLRLLSSFSEKKDMLLVNYEAPNGLKLHNRLWNGGNGKGTVLLYHKGRLIDRIHAENIGCEWGEYGMDVAEKM